MIVYHGTSRKIARKILRSGLKPGSWVTTDKHLAKWYAKANKRGRILTFDIPEVQGRTDILQLW